MQQQAVDSKDLSYLYNPGKNPFNPRYSIYNENDNSSLLSVKFFPSDLYFSEANPQGLPTAMLLVTVRLFETGRGRVLADTVAYEVSIARDRGKTEYVYNVPLNVEPAKEYMAEVRVFDRIRLQSVQSFVPFNTLSYNNKYNFKALGHFEKNQLFTPIIRINEYVNLVYDKLRADSLYISYYDLYRWWIRSLLCQLYLWLRSP
jgi:hypothetical protein